MIPELPSLGAPSTPLSRGSPSLGRWVLYEKRLPCPLWRRPLCGNRVIRRESVQWAHSSRPLQQEERLSIPGFVTLLLHTQHRDWQLGPGMRHMSYQHHCDRAPQNFQLDFTVHLESADATYQSGCFKSRISDPTSSFVVFGYKIDFKNDLSPQHSQW